MIDNKALWDELIKHEYPLSDYKAFAVAWPYTPDEIRHTHKCMDALGVKPAVKERACGNCGFVVNQIKIDMAKFDFDCPKCGERKLSEFIAK